MKKLMLVAVLLLPLCFVGCSSDDEEAPPVGPTGPPRVVGYAAASAPSANDLGDTEWSSATPTLINVPSSQFSPEAGVRPERSTAMAVSDQVLVSAITFGDTLYVRVVWDDATHDVWRGRYSVDSIGTSAVVTHRDEIASIEDQLMLLFKGFTGEQIDDRDVWHWRALTTASIKLGGDTLTGFAEGKTLSNGSLTTDVGDLEAVISNGQMFFEDLNPDKMHKDSAAFSDYILYNDPSVYVPYSASVDVGWTLGQKIPGYRIDSTLAGSVRAANRLSRWDTWALSAYDDVAGQYTVVLRRPFTTGFADDLPMATLDSVQVKVAISNNRDFTLTSGSSYQGLTGDFWIIF